MSIAEQRKTRTSSAVKRRYNEKHYKRFQADIKIELFDKITEYTEKNGISKAEFLNRSIQKLEE